MNSDTKLVAVQLAIENCGRKFVDVPKRDDFPVRFLYV